MYFNGILFYFAAGSVAKKSNIQKGIFLIASLMLTALHMISWASQSSSLPHRKDRSGPPPQTTNIQHLITASTATTTTTAKNKMKLPQKRRKRSGGEELTWTFFLTVYRIENMLYLKLWQHSWSFQGCRKQNKKKIVIMKMNYFF